MHYFLETKNGHGNKGGNLELTETRTTFLSKTNQPCGKYSDEEFVNCSKKAILETLIPKISCITYSIKEFVDSNLAKLPECKSKKRALTTFETFTNHIDDYISRTSEFGCPVPCKQKSVKYDLEYFSKNTYFEPDEKKYVDNDIFQLIVSFKTMNIEAKKETYVYDNVNFLTAAGGNLGLFMGFSCLSIIFSLIDNLNQLF